MTSQDNKQVIYMYDLPQHIVTSVKIHSIVKEKCGVEFSEAVQFRDYQPNAMTGLPSPFKKALIKVDAHDAKKVLDTIKYFEITDGTGITWQCRCLPYDKDLVGQNK